MDRPAPPRSRWFADGRQTRGPGAGPGGEVVVARTVSSARMMMEPQHNGSSYAARELCEDGPGTSRSTNAERICHRPIMSVLRARWVSQGSAHPTGSMSAED